MKCENCNTLEASQTVEVTSTASHIFLELWNVCDGCVSKVADHARRFGFLAEVDAR